MSYQEGTQVRVSNREEGLRNALSEPEQEKHRMIIEAIHRVRAVSDRLDSLIDRITGSPSPETTSAGFGGESLSYVLEHAPGALEETAERMHKQIAEIEAMLFG